MAEKEIKVLVSRLDLEQLPANCTKSIVVFPEHSLRPLFGDCPEKYVVRAKIVVDEADQARNKAEH
ncbi:MAG: hypothetical protein PHI88_01515 [Candidatus Pacebacteria bacterium]|nr:hypothetical protein [Candidatus Paceibacterota bacterium]